MLYRSFGFSTAVTILLGFSLAPAQTPDSTRPTVGYAIATADASQSLPAGLLVYGLIQNSVLVSETGVPASPAIRNAALLAEISPGLNGGVAIANPNDRSATVTLALVDANAGAQLGKTTVTIPANGQTAKLLTELFPAFTNPSTGVFRGVLGMISDVPVASTALRISSNSRGESLLTTLPVVNLDETPSSQIRMLPQIADGGGFTTQIALVNPAGRVLEGNIEFYRQNGNALPVSIKTQRVSSVRYSIPPYGLFFTQSDGTQVDVSVGSAIVRPDTGQAAPSATAIFSYRLRDVLVSEAAVPASPQVRRARIYVDYSQLRNTGLAISTPPGSPLHAQLTFNRIDVTADPITTTLDLQAGGQTARFIDEMFSVSRPSRGVLEISANTPFAVVALRQTATARDDVLFTTLPIATPEIAQPSTLIFPHLVLGGGYYTEVILLGNGEASASRITTIEPEPKPLTNFSGVIVFRQGNPPAPLAVWLNGIFGVTFPFNVPNVGALPLLPQATAPNPVILTSALPDARVGIPYDVLLVASGGAPNYVWALNGSLPPGLRFFPAGRIAGIPAQLPPETTRRQDFFTVQATDAGNRVVTANLSITTRAAPLVFPLPNPLPAATVGVRYLFPLPLPIGGAPPYRYQLQTAGGFPPFGITIDPTGFVSGTPVAAGISAFMICAVDSVGENSCVATTLAVQPPPRRNLVVNRRAGGRRAQIPGAAVDTPDGTVTSNPAGINCGGVCNAQYDDGTRVALTATPDANSVFSGWDGDCKGTGECVLIMNADKNVTADFARKVFVLVGKSGDGSGAVTSNPAGITCGSTCSAGFAEGAQVTLTATPTSGSAFAGWEGACIGTGPCNLVLDSDKAVTARFVLSSVQQQRTLTVSRSGAGSGTITSNPAGINCGSTCAAVYADRAQVTLTATASMGSIFTGWSGACAGTGTCTLTMDSDKTAIANFSRAFFVLAGKSGNGAGTVSSSPPGVNCGGTCSAGFAEGTQVTLTAAPDPGSTFSGWSGACTGTGSCALSMNADKAVTAAFSAQTPPAPPSGNSGSYRGAFTGAAVDSTTFSPCRFQHSLSATLFMTISGSGISSSPYSGPFTGSGTDVITVTQNNASNSCFGDTISGPIVGSVSGSAGLVEAHGTVNAAGTTVFIDVTNGTFSGNTLTGTIRIRNEFFDAPVTGTVVLTKQ